MGASFKTTVTSNVRFELMLRSVGHNVNDLGFDLLSKILVGGVPKWNDVTSYVFGNDAGIACFHLREEPRNDLLCSRRDASTAGAILARFEDIHSSNQLC